MGKAESTGTVEKQGNPTAYTYVERAHTHTPPPHKGHTEHEQCCMAGSDCDDGSHVRVDGVRLCLCTVGVGHQTKVNQDCWASVLQYMSLKTLLCYCVKKLYVYPREETIRGISKAAFHAF